MRTRIVTILAGLVLAAALAGGVAYATIPAADGAINGCYRTSLDDQKGQLRIVDDPASCRSSEMAIHWNQVGPRGIQGLQGPKGEKGDTGDTGAAGTNGTNGLDGQDGQPGTNGINGVDGAPGANGTNGTDGAPGADGTNGTDGVSVTSAVEGAGANCANGGSKFTAANGVTFACNGSAGSGSASPVLFSRSGVEQAAFADGGTLADTSAGTLIWNCDSGTTANDTAVTVSFLTFGSHISASASEGLTTAMTPSSSASSKLFAVARSDHPPNPRPFAVTFVLTNGLSIAVRGLASAAPHGPASCSIAYDMTVSKN